MILKKNLYQPKICFYTVNANEEPSIDQLFEEYYNCFDDSKNDFIIIKNDEYLEEDDISFIDEEH